MAITLRNKMDGSSIFVDTFEARIRRMRSRVGAWCRAIDSYKTDYHLSMITLTYRNGAVWNPNQVREFMLSLKKWAGDRLLAYAWVAELGEENGRLHYHVMVMLKRGKKMPKPDKSGWWVYGASRIETARTPFYIVSYLKKGSHKWAGRLHVQGAKCGADGFPLRLRLYAVVIYSRFPIDDSDRNVFRSSAWKSSVRREVLNHVDYSEDWSAVRAFPVPGGGWQVDSFRGSSFIESAWELVRDTAQEFVESLMGLEQILFYDLELGWQVVTLSAGESVGWGPGGLPIVAKWDDDNNWAWVDDLALM